ncbi:uncharacterized protein METZ01_LOCUS442791 [marine metagenome]|uniref:Uncharacterized protein n=1 Tax=marine metagenome TaxID=408172 RepID=A0A382Z333_9ZZZZ
MEQLEFDFITTEEEQTHYIRLLLLGYDILKEYADYEKELDYVCRMIKAYEDEIKDCQSDIKEFSQTDNNVIDFRRDLIREVCTLHIELANRKIISLVEQESNLLSKMENLNLNMMNKIKVGLNESLNTVRLNKGIEPKIYTGLSVAQG